MQKYLDSRWDELSRLSYSPERAAVLMSVRLSVARRELGFAARRLFVRRLPQPTHSSLQTRQGGL